MKALIRKHGYTPTKESQDEVYLQPWLDWISEDGRELTDECYCYALCEEVPDDPVYVDGQDARLNLDNYEVTEHEKEVPGDEPETTRTVKYWSAIYTGATSEPVDEESEDTE